MALITCTECGKQFSDKAACCPNCGCPTSEITGTAVTLNTAAQGAANREAAEKKMYEAVELAKREAKRASDTFDRDKGDFTRRVERTTIDLFGVNALAQVTGFAAEAKKLCDELYASYQLQLVTLDAACRPLLALEPHGKAAELFTEPGKAYLLGIVVDCEGSVGRHGLAHALYPGR